MEYGQRQRLSGVGRGRYGVYWRSLDLCRGTGTSPREPAVRSPIAHHWHSSKPTLQRRNRIYWARRRAKSGTRTATAREHRCHFCGFRDGWGWKNRIGVAICAKKIPRGGLSRWTLLASGTRGCGSANHKFCTISSGSNSTRESGIGGKGALVLAALARWSRIADF